MGVACFWWLSQLRLYSSFERPWPIRRNDLTQDFGTLELYVVQQKTLGVEGL